jgi:micrococcal nuclease
LYLLFPNEIKINNIVLSIFLLISIVGYFTILLYFPIQEISARCPKGYHKSPSGDCEKVTDTKEMPRCNNGYHRSPDGDCEKVSNIDNEKNTDNDYVNSLNKIKSENSEFEYINNPFNKIFSNNYKDNINSKLLEEKNEKEYNNNYNRDEIELKGKVTYVVDGDTLDINDIRIRLSLVDTPERGEDGYKEAKNFVKDVCLDKNGEVNIDNGQRGGDRYGREIGVVYCDGINVNKELVENNLARIYTEFCNISEFKDEKWAKPFC